MRDFTNVRTLSTFFLNIGVLIIGLAWADMAQADQRPNVMIILADDLGFSDLGCYGGEIDTPNLDSLATNGLRFTRFYNTGRCWPTRSCLLTGYYAQQVRRDKLPGVNPSGAAGQRPSWAPLLPVRLRELGYRSYHTGKWHIDSMPVKAGFDDSYFLGDQARFFSPQRRFRDDQALPAIQRGSDYYATIDLADEAIRALKSHLEHHAEAPFFHYIALTAPHFPLHALPEDIAKYNERYRAGWDEIRQQRWQKIQQLGVANHQLSEMEFDTGAPYKRPDDIKAYGPGEVALPKPWNELSAEQKEFQTVKMAIHAAMIDRIDQELGRVFQQLKDMGEFDNTLILFLSDNGCSSELMIRDDGHNPNAEPGSADTHLCLGPGWSTVCNTPFRKHKTWVHEGGIATPLIAHWPNGIAQEQRNTLRHQPTHLIDIAPTVVKMAGSQLAAVQGGPSPPGKELTAVLRDNQPVPRDWLWWSHDNHSAIQVDGWKLVQVADSQWELYQLATDGAETQDVADQYPERLQTLKALWTKTRDEFIEHATREK